MLARWLVVQLSLMNWARTQPWKAGLAFLLVWAGLGLVYAWSVYANMNADPSWQPAIWEIGLVLLPIPGALALLYTGWRERDQRQSAVRSA
ncbi:MAG TPA: hypothetical protein VF071_10405 [Candidatus Limnocylindria bacterium]